MKDILVIDDFILIVVFNKATILVQCSMDVYIVFTKSREDIETNYQIPFETIFNLK